MADNMQAAERAFVNHPEKIPTAVAGSKKVKIGDISVTGNAGVILSDKNPLGNGLANGNVRLDLPSGFNVNGGITAPYDNDKFGSPIFTYGGGYKNDGYAIDFTRTEAKGLNPDNRVMFSKSWQF